MSIAFQTWLDDIGIKIVDEKSIFTNHTDTKILLKIIEALWNEIQELKDD